MARAATCSRCSRWPFALRARGHDALFVAPSNFVDWIRGSGFEAESNGTDIEVAMQVPRLRSDSIRWQLRLLKDHTARLFEPLARRSEGADLIVGAGAQMVSASIAEWRERAAREHRVLSVRDSRQRGAAAGVPDADVPAVVQSPAVAGRRRRSATSPCAAPSTEVARRSACTRPTVRSATSRALRHPRSRSRSGAARRRWPRCVVVHGRLDLRRAGYARPASRRIPESGSRADLRRLRQHGGDPGGSAGGARRRRRARRRPSADSRRRMGAVSIGTPPTAMIVLTVDAVSHQAVFRASRWRSITAGRAPPRRWRRPACHR